MTDIRKNLISSLTGAFSRRLPPGETAPAIAAGAFLGEKMEGNVAFDANNLTTLTYGGGFTLWHYRTTDRLDEVLSAPPVSARSYFASAHEVFGVGDVVFIRTRDDTAQAAVVAVDGEQVFIGLMAFAPIERAQSLKAAE